MRNRGSLIGSSILFAIARKGGDLMLSRQLATPRGARMHRWFERYGLITVFVPALSPLPLPMKVPVFCAGALKVRWSYFLGVVFAARLPRYFALAFFGARYGAQTLLYLRDSSSERCHLRFDACRRNRDSVADHGSAPAQTIRTRSQGCQLTRETANAEIGLQPFVCDCLLRSRDHRAASIQPGSGKIAQQLSAVANYTCILTVDRSCMSNIKDATRGVRDQIGHRKSPSCTIGFAWMSRSLKGLRYFPGMAGRSFRLRA